MVLTGPSGSGKTTLIRLVNGLAPSYYHGRFSGTISIDGRDRSDEPLWMRGKTVGSVFQDPNSQFFSSEMRGEVAFGCENYGLPHEEIVFRTDSAIERFKLENPEKRRKDTSDCRTPAFISDGIGGPICICTEWSHPVGTDA